MAVGYERLRVLVLEYVRIYPKYQVNLKTDRYWEESCRKNGLTLNDADLEVVQQIFHELYLERILITGSSANSMGSEGMCWPFYRLTEFGRKALETTEYTPYDPDGYLSRLRRDIPALTDVVVRYLKEAIDCYRAGHLLAAAVMLGCAAEKGMLELVEAFRDAITDPAKKAAFEKETKNWQIKSKYDALWKRLEPMASSLPSATRR